MYKHIIVFPAENTSWFRMFGHSDPNRNLYFNETREGDRIYANETKTPFIGHDTNANYHKYTKMAINRDEKTGIAAMDGFVKGTQDFVDPKEMMSYNPKNAFPMINFLAENYKRCDRYFSSYPGDTIPNISTITLVRPITGVKMSELNQDPYLADDKKYDQNQKTIFDFFKKNKISWNLASEDWAMQLHLKSQWSMENLARYESHQDLWDHIEDGTLAQFTYLDAAYQFITSPTKLGYLTYYDDLLRKLYTKLKNSSYWENTLIIFTFDEHGSSFDPFPVPKGLGVRVPAILIAKNLSKNGHDKTQYDHASIVKFILENFLIEKETTELFYKNVNAFVIPSHHNFKDCKTILPSPPFNYFLEAESTQYKIAFALLNTTRSFVSNVASKFMYWKCKLNFQNDVCYQWKS